MTGMSSADSVGLRLIGRLVREKEETSPRPTPTLLIYSTPVASPLSPSILSQSLSETSDSQGRWSRPCIRPACRDDRSIQLWAVRRPGPPQFALVIAVVFVLDLSTSAHQPRLADCDQSILAKPLFR